MFGGSSDSGLADVSTGSRSISTHDFSDYYPVVTTDGRTRVGGRQLAPPITHPTSLSRSDNSSQLRAERRRRPNEPWGTNSDSAQQIVAHAVTGNEPLPETHRAYIIMMNYAVKTYQLLKRGGLNARNWLRHECKSGGWVVPSTHPTVGDNWVAVGSVSEIEIIGGPPVEDCHTGGKPKRWIFLHPKRCGSADVLRETAQETANRITTTQESYDAKMHYAKTARKIHIRMNSLSTGNRASYSRSWGRWPDFANAKISLFG